jgi:hypothetical protein
MKSPKMAMCSDANVAYCFAVRACVKGHEGLPGGGHQTCPVTVTGSAQLAISVAGGQASGITPWPARPWLSRTLPPLV